MHLYIQAFWLPKSGNTAEEYEDAFWYGLQLGRFAIADGATESSFAGQWSRSLVQAYATFPPYDSASGLPRLQGWLEPLQDDWHKSINWKRLPWFAEEKAQAGGFSTLLGLSFEPLEGDRGVTAPAFWNAIAVGDSCLFHVRGDILSSAFPLDRAEEFNNSPPLLSSNPENNRRVWDKVYFANGDCRPNDLFLLSTDALAYWFLAQYEAGQRPWTILQNIYEQADFEELVDHLRQERLIRNDDTTLLIIRLMPDSPVGDGTSGQEKSED